MIADLDDHLPAIRQGDAAAFARWMASAEPTLRLSLRSFATTIDVESILQEALLRTWSYAPRVVSDGKPNALFRVALRIGRNLAVSERRRRRPMTGIGAGAGNDETLLALVDETPPQFVDPLLLARVRECHARLPDKPRQALAARLESQGADADEDLAARLEMRLNTFLQNFTRARKMLIECLRAMGIDPTELA